MTSPTHTLKVTILTSADSPPPSVPIPLTPAGLSIPERWPSLAYTCVSEGKSGWGRVERDQGQTLGAPHPPGLPLGVGSIKGARSPFMGTQSTAWVKSPAMTTEHREEADEVAQSQTAMVFPRLSGGR